MPKVQHAWVGMGPILDSSPQAELHEVRDGTGGAPDFVGGTAVIGAGPELRAALLQTDL